MSILRFVATLCLLVAAIALVSDLTPYLSGASSLSISSIEEHWKEVAPATFQSVESSFAGGHQGWLWTYVIGPLVATPTVLMFSALALLAGYAGRRQARVKVFAN